MNSSKKTIINPSVGLGKPRMMRAMLKQFESMEKPRVIEMSGGPYSLFCLDCGCWVPNTANAEMRKEGFIAYTHNCKDGICDMKNGEKVEGVRFVKLRKGR